MHQNILQLLSKLPEPYATQAAENYDPNFYEEGVAIDNIADAVGWAFNWKESPQGEQYWRRLQHIFVSPILYECFACSSIWEPGSEEYELQTCSACGWAPKKTDEL